MTINSLIAALYWNPERVVFTLPVIDRPIMWYGVFFVLGFIIGYFLAIPMFSRKISQGKTISYNDVEDWATFVSALRYPTEQTNSLVKKTLSKLNSHSLKELEELHSNSEPPHDLHDNIVIAFNAALQDSKFTQGELNALFPNVFVSVRSASLCMVDRLCWFVILGTLIGARLGHVFFYEWPHYRENPWDIIKAWEGGLASHGGVLGVMLAIFLFQRMARKLYPTLTFLTVLDIVAVISPLAGFFIRIGNFFNQEILGTQTNVPWAIIFGDPADGSAPVPRHPVQLYEGIVYLGLFMFLFTLWKKKGNTLKPGVLTGLLFILLFSARFFLEFFKADQHSSLLDTSMLQMGQYLSLPFIIFGFVLYFYGKKIDRFTDPTATA